MKVKELIMKLKKFDPDIEVFSKTCFTVGNCWEVERAILENYGFFGHDIPAVFLDNGADDE